MESVKQNRRFWGGLHNRNGYFKEICVTWPAVNLMIVSLVLKHLEWTQNKGPVSYTHLAQKHNFCSWLCQKAVLEFLNIEMNRKHQNRWPRVVTGKGRFERAVDGEITAVDVAANGLGRANRKAERWVGETGFDRDIEWHMLVCPECVLPVRAGELGWYRRSRCV